MKLTERELSALRQYMAALAAMPKTENAKTAARQQRILRESLRIAAAAIPCWVMPEARVIEQLPSELGSFDLVVIDEASQSNINALPVVLRGRKLLLVGDDKQVAPTGLLSNQIKEEDVTRLRTTYLKGQQLADHMHPDTSLYALGGFMYPGKVIMLRDHFRCVAPIIGFSTRFYGGQLRPLRLPAASERIDPPLVDILVEDGRRKGHENEAEAAVIVDEIERLIDDSKLNAGGPRSIGVITLHEALQAERIQARLIDRIGTDKMRRHRIMCGNPAMFQGQERDVVFLSMVQDDVSARKATRPETEQRFNVALSRARDRMVLVRSVTISALKEGDIKRAVLEYFLNPPGGAVGPSKDVLAACQSEFERKVGRRLIEAGYRVRAQVQAGGYFIDFVVEGPGDRRLAIELDGDSFHGPDRWADDMRRQKALERLGWTFWRCWASEYALDPTGTFRELIARMDSLGITPTGAEANGPVVEFRRVHAANPALLAPLQPPLPAPVVESSPALERPTESPSFTLAPTALEQAATTRDDVLASAATTPEPGRMVRVGDQVVVRYVDGKKRGKQTVTIVGDGVQPGAGRIAPSAPLAKAILGLRVEDEAELEIDGCRHVAIIEDIRRAA